MRINRTFLGPAAGIGLVVLTVAGLGGATAYGTASTASTASTGTVKCAADYSPIPQNWSTEKGGLDIGRLVKVTSAKGVVKVRINRVSFYRGAEAVALNNGKQPLDGYIETDTNTRQQTFTLDPKASLQAENLLRNDPNAGVGREKLTRAQFIRNANRRGDESPIGTLV